MPKRAIIYFAGFLIAIVGFLVFDHSMRNRYIVQQALLRAKALQKEQQAVSTQKVDHTEFAKRFKNFVQQVKQTEDPDRSDELLNLFAKTVQTENTFYLLDVLRETQNARGARNLALELLAQNQNFKTHQMLNDFAQDENFIAHANDDYEFALRAQAIEAMSLYSDKKLVLKNLENLRMRTRHAFLYDRAGKAMAYMTDENASVRLGVDGYHAEAIKK